MNDTVKDIVMFIIKTLIVIIFSLVALSYNGIIEDIKEMKASQLTLSDVHEAITKRIKNNP